MAAPLTLLTEAEFRQSKYGDAVVGVARPGTFIAQAEAYIQNYIDRKIAVAEYTEHHLLDQRFIFLRQYPILDIIGIRRRYSRTGTWETLDPTMSRVRYYELPVVEYLDSDMSGYEVEVVYEAGYDPVPEDIKQAVALQTALNASVDIEVYGVGDGKPPGIIYMQDVVHQLVKPYKRARRMF